MARPLRTLSSRLVLIMLLSHAVLLPLLFFALEAVVKRGVLDAFVNDARIQGRLFADNLEQLDYSSDEAGVVAQLDSAILGGRIIHATLTRGDSVIKSSLMTDADVELFVEDFSFGEHEDDTYFLSLPIVESNDMAILRLGFDEVQAREHFQSVRRSILVVIVLYMFVTLIAASYLSMVVVRPLRWLQRASRMVASGEYDKRLRPDSDLVEITNLSHDLEHMRSNLVGVNARLQQEIADRESAEAERQLLESRLQHAQRLESLGTLAGGVAHEFNNVLQPLLLYTDLALEDLPEDSPVEPNLVRVLNLATRAKRLSQQILTFSRHSDQAIFKEIHVTPVVEEAIAMIRALLPASVDIRTDIHCRSDMVKCDSAQIQQLVVNLCTNAYQALDGDGHIMIALSCELVSADRAAQYPNLQEGKYVVLEVADTGRGMDTETMVRAFEPFYTTQDVGQGTGLGLSVVHGIVIRHGGEIVCESDPGEGTRFQVYLPMADEPEQTQELTG